MGAVTNRVLDPCPVREAAWKEQIRKQRQYEKAYRQRKKERRQQLQLCGSAVPQIAAAPQIAKPTVLQSLVVGSVLRTIADHMQAASLQRSPAPPEPPKPPPPSPPVTSPPSSEAALPEESHCQPCALQSESAPRATASEWADFESILGERDDGDGGEATDEAPPPHCPLLRSQPKPASDLSNVGGVYKVVATQAALKAGQHSKDAKSRNLADTLSSIIRSGRKTRAAAKIWAAEPENSASSLAPTMPFSQPLLPQPLTVLFDEPEPLALPAPTLAADWLPGGSRHCGGDLLFALLTLVHPDGQRRIPLFAKKSGSITAFPGSDLTHGTTRHDPRGQRLPGCEAHVSFAVQTPAATLGVSRTSKAGKAMHEQLLSAGEQDILEGPLRRGGERGAVWLAVQNAEAWAQKPKCQLEYNAATMWALPYEAVVLYDVVSGRPLVAYDAFGGLVGDEAVRAAATFRFLDSFKFTLNRQRESYAQGALGLDGAGEQRMLMLGIRHQSFNMGNRPDKGKQGRVWLSVKNYIGDLDAYVAHWDHRHACSSAHLQPVWNAMAARMRAHLPQFCSKLEAALRAADVEKRLYCEQSGGMISDDLIVNNVGASSYYQSPSHVDQNDRGWTFAVAVKCVSPQSGMRCNCGQQTANQQT